MKFEKYNHKKQEKIISDYWIKNKCFRPIKTKLNKKFSIVIPPPNITGRLHMGHALNNSLQDVIVRFKRMKGFETLWQPGTDHAGIATQAIVEKKLEKEKINKNKLGRDNFIKLVWDWKKKSGGEILDQLKKLGCSCDWSRTRFTMDKDLSKAVIKVFVDLYKNKLIFKDKKLVNWDTQLKTAISDLEVVQRDVQSQLYFIEYPIENSDKKITIATTRPETMMGDTAIAVNPKDERYKSLVGKNVNIPLVNRYIKIITDHYADPDQGTGAVKITPAHDFNDYEVGKRNNLQIINILEKNGSINHNGIEELIGLDRFEARKILIKKLKEQGYLTKIESIKNKVPYGDRSNTIIEPLLTEQWFVDAKKLSIKPIKVVKEKKTIFYPENWTKTYFQWMNNIEPWCISRQIWWGHRIPAWYDDKNNIFVAENEEEALKLSQKKNKKKVILKQDTDVLDTWFSSALWPFATLGWPKKTKELSKFYPTSVLVTGFDIIFFWVARMLMMGNFFNKKTPFNKVYVHALVRDEKGQKMSKSKGNVIDPLSLIEEYGADSLRFTLISMASPGRDVKLSKDRVTGNRNFITKIWSANNFLKLNKCKLINKNINVKSIKLPINHWIYNELIKTQKLVSNNLEAFRFDEAAKYVYQFVWHSYCDWYLEFLKPILNSRKNSELNEARNFASFIMVNILKMLHPFIPFFTESVWSKNNYNKVFKTDLILSKWPDYKSINKFNKNYNDINDLIDFISSIRSTKSELKITPKLFCDIHFLEKNSKLKSIVNNNLVFAKQVGRINEILNSEAANKNTIKILSSNEKISLSFNENIDLFSQKQKISQKIDVLDKKINSIKTKLSNKAYLKNAPKNIVENDKKLLKELTIEDNKLRSIVSSIN